ncbi:MAG: hypothetical protein KKE16_00755 [Firmicutes bacterium]|nr:hypothetical protein [Bacillota bacterium]
MKLIHSDKRNILLMMWIHLLIDGISVSTIFILGGSAETIALAVIAYDVLAFALQPLIGILVDIKKIEKQFIILGLGMAVLVTYLPLPLLLVSILIGIANAMVHVGGFSITYQSSKDFMGPLGLFVSTGSIGLGLGLLFPQTRLLFFILSILSIGLVILLYKKMQFEPIEAHKEKYQFDVFPIILVLTVVLLRGFGGSILPPKYESTTISTMMIYIALFVGKAAGGLIADKIGINNTILFGFVPSFIGFVFFSNNQVLYLISVILFNFTMALTLYLTIRALKPFASFAFGLTAALLFFGVVLASGFKEVTSVKPWMGGIVVVISCVLILLANHQISKNTIIGGTQ